jgi:hypothetical protein
MGFNKYYVPEPAELVKQISISGPTEFRKNRLKIDAMIGSTDSVRIVEHVFDLVSMGTSDPEILESLTAKFPSLFSNLEPS